MKVFSQLNPNQSKTQKDAAIHTAASLTGLSEKHIQFLYESENLDKILSGMTQIKEPFFTSKISTDTVKTYKKDLKGFNGNVMRNEIGKNNFSIYEEVLKILDSNELSKTKMEAVIALTEKCKQLNSLDSVDVLNGIATLLMISDDNSKQYILGLNNLHEPNLNPEKELRKLNENYQFDLLFDSNLKIDFTEDIDNTKYLFENLKDILKRQNRRWGNSYRLQNTYNGIMNYLESEIEQIQIKNEIVSVDSNFHLYLIKDFIYGNHNPLYRDYNSIKNVCSDIQTLVFDIMILIAKHINDNSEALKFLKRDTFKDYMKINNMLILNISSSLLKSKIVKDSFKNKLNNIYIGRDEKDVVGDDLPLISELITNIDVSKFNEYEFNPSLSTLQITNKSALDMLWLINSTTPDFNLRLRPIIKQYVTKAMELINSVQKVNFELIKFKNKQ